MYLVVTQQLIQFNSFPKLLKILPILAMVGLLIACKSNDNDLKLVVEDEINGPLAWPIDCIPGETCLHIGYPDIDETGTAYDCGSPGYFGHQGTDISISLDQKENGVAVYAAADGVVLWVFDGKYDNCPDNHPDCDTPPEGWFQPGQTNGYRVCTQLGYYCHSGDCCCFWCFDGGNVVVIRHDDIPGLFATRYDHFKTNSIVVEPGESVIQGQKIGEVGSAGNSTGPHLHFEVWGNGFYKLADPWAGECGPNHASSMWMYDPPWNSGS